MQRLYQAVNGKEPGAWIAMALTQESDIILLDGPTTYSDIVHQLEVLDLVKNLNQRQCRTIAAWLHDMNQAVRYSDYICALKYGEIVYSSEGEGVMKPGILRQVYGIEATIVQGASMDKPVCIL